MKSERQSCTCRGNEMKIQDSIAENLIEDLMITKVDNFLLDTVGHKIEKIKMNTVKYEIEKELTVKIEDFTTIEYLEKYPDKFSHLWCITNSLYDTILEIIQNE